MQVSLKKITKQTIVIVLVLATLLLALHISYITTRLDRETENTLRKMADYDVLLLQDKITMEMMDLQRSAVYFSDINEDDFLDSTTAASSIRNFNKTHSGNQTLKLISTTGMAYDFIQEAQSEVNNYSLQVSQGGVGDTKIQHGAEEVQQIYFSVPVKKSEKIVATLVKTVTMNYFSREIVGDTFHDDGYLIVIKADGSYIFVPEELRPAFIGITNNVYDVFVENTNNEANSLKKNVATKKSGSFFYNLLGENKYIYYQSLGISDWYILSVMDAKQITKTSREITWVTIGYSFSGLVLLLIAAWYIFSLKESNRKELYNIAYIDMVTGGNNFNKFRKDSQLIFDNHRGKHALVVFDIDKFKIFNDLHGFATGDVILRHFHNVLVKSLQANELFARLRSDKFVVLMNYTTKELILERLNDIAQNFCDVQLSETDDAAATLKIIDKENVLFDSKDYDTDKSEDSFNYMFSVSTGIYQVPSDMISLDLMLDRAFIALKNGKETFGSSFAFYEDEQRANLLREKEIENAMTTALSNKEFIVFLQPKYDVSTLKIIGAEALLRWQRDDTNSTHISPGEFIPLFEKNGFIARVDQFVLEEVCKQILLWRKLGDHMVVPCSVNMSRTQLYNRNFIEMFKQTVLKYKLSPADIEIEITESVVFDDAKLLIKIINDIRKFGFSIAIDDFGAGYSSLNLIKDIPADTLKLDQKFFDNFEANQRAHLVIETIVKMAKQLDMKVVAEGIETEEQLNFLRHISCEYAQGFFLARPMPMDAFAKLLVKTNCQ